MFAVTNVVMQSEFIQLSPMLLSFLPTLAVTVGLWGMFDKAGEPPWAALVPVYNFYVLFKIAGIEWWIAAMFFVPVVNIIAILAVGVYVADAFGKDGVYSFATALLPFIFYPILGFGNAEYEGPD